MKLATQSTNDDVFALLQECKGPAIVLAQFQSAGRGRRGRDWFAPLGANLYFSLGFNWHQGAATLEGLSLCVALALQTYLTDAGFTGIEIKWPNDLLYQGSKLAGILLELRGDCTDQLDVVVGIGLNVAMTKKQLSNIARPVTTLAHIAALPTDFNAFVAHLLLALEDELLCFKKTDLGNRWQSWRAVDALYQRGVSAMVDGQRICGVGAGLDARGGYKIRHAQGEYVCRGGEISLYSDFKDDSQY